MRNPLTPHHPMFTHPTFQHSRIVHRVMTILCNTQRPARWNIRHTREPHTARYASTSDALSHTAHIRTCALVPGFSVRGVAFHCACAASHRPHRRRARARRTSMARSEQGVFERVYVRFMLRRICCCRAVLYRHRYCSIRTLKHRHAQKTHPTRLLRNCAIA